MHFHVTRKKWFFILTLLIILSFAFFSSHMGNREYVSKNLLFQYIEADDIISLQALLESSPNILQSRYNTSEYTLLHITAIDNSPSSARLLINLGVDVNIPDIFNSTPLHYAAKNDSASVAQVLIENHANVTIRDKAFNYTPMHYCVYLGNVATLKVLCNSSDPLAVKNILPELVAIAKLEGNEECLNILSTIPELK